MPLDNPEQTDPNAPLDWSSAPDQFRSQFDRVKQQHEEAQAKLEAVVRENTARTAGIDVESPLGKLFIGSYTGEMNPQAMKAKFDELGIAQAPSVEAPPTTPPTDGPTPEELEEARVRGALHGQAQPPGTEPVGDLWTGSGGVFDTFQQNMKKGMRRDDAGAVALDVLFSAAMDPNHPQHDQAIWNRQQWLESQRP